MPPVLSAAQLAQFDRDGFLVVPQFLAPTETARLIARARTLLSEMSLDGHPMTKFETADSESRQHVGDDYFLDSGDKIRYFFEADAFVDGKLARPKEQAVNKIGHALHALDPDFRAVTLEHEGVRQITHDLARHVKPVLPQSMLIFKQPRIGGAIPVHDDSTFLYTKPETALGFWIALEDCTASNGALSFLPGSHKRNKLAKRFVRAPGGGTTFAPIAGVAEPPGWVQPPVQAGDLVLIDGLVIHRSERNLSDKSRFIFTFHIIDDEACYDKLNWLQPSAALPFSPIPAPPV